MPQPLFISLDGLDGTGKSTQCRLLADWLRKQGHDVIECADPGGTTAGDAIREILLGHKHDLSLPCEALLFMASRAQLTADIIRPALEAGRTVISDRFLLANVVYQGYAGGLNRDKLWEIGKLATDGLLPHLTFVLDLPVELALRRRSGTADRVESRDIAYHARVREGFLAEARRQPETIKVVNANQPIPEVHLEICRNLSSIVK
jgi:dTMP kinase